MFLVGATSSVNYSPESGTWRFPSVSKRVGFPRAAGPLMPGAEPPHRDGYLLVLLAAQELEAGRAEQAQSLLDEAYAAFDATTDV